MIYELAHLIKNRFPFLWDVIEWGNSAAFFVVNRKKLRALDATVAEGLPSDLTMKMLQECDVEPLYEFFSEQPEDSFKFFHPHGFDKRSLRKVVRDKSFLAFALRDVAEANEPIVGYAFMRSFVNGASYRGYMVDCRHRGQGLAKIMGLGMNRVGDALGLKMYKSISPDNPASMKVTQAVCDTKTVKRLDNGDYLLRCMSKKCEDEKLMGGGTLAHELKSYEAFRPQMECCYAA